MKELIEKISSYNLFNYLLPGTLFVAFAERITNYQLIQGDIVIALFLYYFIGLVISRIGSLAVEPIMRKVSFLRFAAYEDYVNVSKKDSKLDTLSEANNMYRTFCTLFISLGALELYERTADRLAFPEYVTPCLLFALMFGLFAFSYRKQTSYITKRIEASKDEHC